MDDDLESNATMKIPHMIVRLIRVLKALQTHPANVGLARGTLHMVASLVLLDGCCAPGTLFRSDLVHPFGQHHVSTRFDILLFFAGESFVVFYAAACADSYEAGRAGEDGRGL